MLILALPALTALVCSVSGSPLAPRAQGQSGSFSISARGEADNNKRAAALGITTEELLVRDIKHMREKHKRGLDMARRNGDALFARQQPDAVAAGTSYDWSLGEQFFDSEDFYYYGQAGVGTPQQQANFIIDTAQADSFVTNVTCGSSCQGNKPLFDATRSKTFKYLGQAYDTVLNAVQYLGEAATDTWTIGPLRSVNQTFGVISIENNFAGIQDSTSQDPIYPANGYIGLNFPATSSFSPAALGLPFQLAAQKKLAKNLFSLHLFRGGVAGSTLTFGGIKPPFPSRPIYYSNIVLNQENPSPGFQKPLFWTLATQNLYLNGNGIDTDGWNAILDSSVKAIQLFDRDAITFWKRIPGSQQIGSKDAQTWQYPCNTTATLAFQIQGINQLLPFPLENLKFANASTPGQCIGTIVSSLEDEQVDQQKFTIYGAPFLSAYYTVFDFSTNPPRIGLQQLMGEANI